MMRRKDLTRVFISEFLARIDKSSGDSCWEWKGAASDVGYGRVRFNGKLYSPHRVAWIIENGDIPEDGSYHGTVVMHLCDNPRCCRPSHLRLGTQQDNVTDMMNKGRGCGLAVNPPGYHAKKREIIEHANSHLEINTIPPKELKRMERSRLSNYYWAKRLKTTQQDVQRIRSLLHII